MKIFNVSSWISLEDTPFTQKPLFSEGKNSKFNKKWIIIKITILREKKKTFICNVLLFLPPFSPHERSFGEERSHFLETSNVICTYYTNITIHGLIYKLFWNFDFMTNFTFPRQKLSLHRLTERSLLPEK